MSTVSEKSGFPKKVCSDVSRFILSYPVYSPATQARRHRLFTTIVYLVI